MKKKIIIITILIINIMFFTNIKTVCANSMSASDILSAGSSFINNGRNSPITTSTAIEKLKPIGQILVTVASVVLVIVGMIIGIKYMISGTDEKANIKEKLIWYLISIVLVYGAVGIAIMISGIMQSIT